MKAETELIKRTITSLEIFFGRKKKKEGKFCSKCNLKKSPETGVKFIFVLSTKVLFLAKLAVSERMVLCLRVILKSRCLSKNANLMALMRFIN